MNINEVIKGLREDNDLTQTELGKILSVNQITISQYERGTRQLSPNMIISYAKYFKVSADYILGLTQDPTPNWTDKRTITQKTENNFNNNGNVQNINIHTNNGKITMK